MLPRRSAKREGLRCRRGRRKDFCFAVNLTPAELQNPLQEHRNAEERKTDAHGKKIR